MSPVESLQGGGWKRLLRGLLLMAAAASTVAGVRNALSGSKDFQWSGARVLLAHQDPWAEYLRGDPDRRFAAAQVPNYLPILYLLLAPLGLLPVAFANAAWACCNVAFAVGSAWCAARFYGLRGWAAAGVVLAMLAATPTRVSIGNGQQGLLVLQLMCLSLLAERLTRSSALLAGISYLKFSFAPPVAMFLWFRGGLRAFLWSLAPALGALGLVWAWIAGAGHAGGLARMALEPFRVALHGFPPDASDSDLMSLAASLLRNRSEGLTSLVGGSLALALCMAAAWAAFRPLGRGSKRRASVQWQVAIAAILSFALFRHHSYDGVVLLLPGCFALAHWREWRAQAVLGVLAYLFYAQRAMQALHLQPPAAGLAGFGLLMLLLVLCFEMRSPRRPRRTPSELEQVPSSATRAAA